MRTYLLTSALGLFVAQSALAAWESAILPRGFVHESSISQATTRAAAEGKAVIVYYTRTQCPPCDVLQSRLRKDEVSASFKASYVFTAVWGSSMGLREREEYRSRYGVQGAPTWIVLSAKGEYICTAKGGFDSDEAGPVLHKHIQSRLASGPRSTSEPVECKSPTE